MDRLVYARMAAVENRHWWFVARRQILADALDRLIVLPNRARIIEAGCGTGGNLRALAQFGEVHAFEPDAEARELARDKGGFEVRSGTLPDHIPFNAGSYDLVAALDILEHIDDDARSLLRLGGLLRPGGWALITVPAFPILWSNHDELHHHKRRYRRAELTTKLQAAGFDNIQVSYFNVLLFPIIVLIRLAKKLLAIGGDDDALPKSNLINQVLCTIFASERHLVGRLPIGPGVSLLAVARRPVS